MHRKFWRFSWVDGDLIATPSDEVSNADLGRSPAFDPFASIDRDPGSSNL